MKNMDYKAPAMAVLVLKNADVVTTSPATPTTTTDSADSTTDSF